MDITNVITLFGGLAMFLYGMRLMGDCLTTAIVCNIGAKPNAKRVGVVNILFNLSKTVLILIGVNLAHQLGLLDKLWNTTIHSGGIANTNTVFNLSCALLMFPMLGVYEKLSKRIVKDKDEEEKPAELMQLEALNPVFFSTPALAFNACYEVILEMYDLARENILMAFDIVRETSQEKAKKLRKNEDMLDTVTDSVGNYLVKLSNHITLDKHIEIMDQYNTVIPEFERLGDHALNILEAAENIERSGASLSETARGELDVLRDMIERVMDYTYDAFQHRSIDAAKHIEPLEEVVDDVIDAVKQNHLQRLRKGACSILAGMEYLNILSDIERISDICSNVGTATIVRALPEMKNHIHDYVSGLHAGVDERFNKEYETAHEEFFKALEAVQAK